MAVIGIFILLLSGTPVTYTRSHLRLVTHSTVWLTKSFVVPAHSNVWLNESFFLPDLTNKYVTKKYGFYNFSYLQIDFNVTPGTVIDFRVLDEANYLKMRAGENYHDLGYPSQYNVSGESAQWIPPNDTKIYFVWEHSLPDSASTFVSASFTFNWTNWEPTEVIWSRTLLPPWVTFFGFFIFIIGLLLISYGIKI